MFNLLQNTTKKGAILVYETNIDTNINMLIQKQDILKSLGPKIRKARLDKGFTQEYVAEHINVSIDLLRSIENSRNIGSISTLLNLCNILEITMDYLFIDFLNKSDKNIDSNLYSLLNSISEEDRDTLKKIIIYMDKHYS